MVNRIDKKILRKKYKEIREKEENKKEKSEIIINKILNEDVYINAKVISIYNSFGYEVDTRNLIIESLKKKKVVAIPKVIDSKNMNLYKISSIEDLKCNGSFGIVEPEDIKENIIKAEDLDLIIVPGICFDEKKNRVGFGKGYYDKYLASSKCIKLAICFENQVLKDSLIDASCEDIQMDYIITDKRKIQ